MVLVGDENHRKDKKMRRCRRGVVDEVESSDGGILVPGRRHLGRGLGESRPKQDLLISNNIRIRTSRVWFFGCCGLCQGFSCICSVEYSRLGGVVRGVGDESRTLGLLHGVRRTCQQVIRLVTRVNPSTHHSLANV
jgi:hypothetical protein